MWVTRAAVEKSDGDPLLGATLGDRFSVVGLAKTGSVAAIYEGIDQTSDALVALKVARSDGAYVPAAFPSFGRERRALTECVSPRIVSLIASGVSARPEAHFLALGWLDGESLRERLRREVVGAADAERIVVDVADALSEVHRRGWVHADLKPANVIVGRDGRATLLDFGSCVAKGALSETLTPLYAAPEQWRGEPVDERTDLYALGCLAHELATGRPPFSGSTEALRHLHLEGSLEVGPGALGALAARLLRREPRDRMASAEEVVAEMGPWLA